MTARPRWALTTGLALTALVLAGTAYFKAEPGALGIDTLWRDGVVSTRNDLLTGPAKVIDILGNFGLALASLVLMIRWAVTGRRAHALFLFTVVLVSSIATQSIKHFVLRPRPVDPMVHVDTGSFPSGHAMSVLSMALVAILILGMSRRTGVLLLAGSAAVIIWNRTYLGAHWISDTVAGGAIGIAITLLLWWAFAARLAHGLARPGDGLADTRRGDHLGVTAQARSGR